MPKLATFILAVATAFSGSGSDAQAGESTLIDYEMKDQFEEVHRRDDVVGSIVILIGSDKGGSKYNKKWGKAIRAGREEEGLEGIVFLPVADVRGVPFFLKGMVKGKFPKQPEEWALVDWKGRFAKAYDFTPGSTNLLVFAPDGELVHRVVGQEVDQEALDELLAIVNELRTLAPPVGEISIYKRSLSSLHGKRLRHGAEAGQSSSLRHP